MAWREVGGGGGGDVVGRGGGGAAWLSISKLELNFTEHQLVWVELDDDDDDRIQRCNSRFYTIFSLRRELSPTHMLKWPRSNQCASFH